MSSKHQRFSVGDALGKQHGIDSEGGCGKRYELLGKIFTHTIDEVGDKYFLFDPSAHQEALMVSPSSA